MLRSRYAISQYWLAIVLFGVMACCAAESLATEVKWWDQEKIRFFWGQSHHFHEAGVSDDKLMASLSKVGATVYVLQISSTATVNDQLQRAEVAKKHGLHPFGMLYVSNLPAIAKTLDGPLAVDAEGNSNPNLPDPFFKPAYEKWFLEPALKMAKSGLVDGLHFDWEFYGKRGEGREVYNDEYFNAFLKSQGISESVPVTQRYRWLVEKNLYHAYLVSLRDLTEEMFRDFADQIRNVKPDFIFSSYDSFSGDLGNGGWRSSGISAGLHRPSAPNLVIDPRHYWDYSACPWWDSNYNYHHKLGYKHIGGTYDWRLFGGRPDTELSAVEWMVENAIHSDGYWVWTEREFGTYEWQAFAAADRRIKGVERKVGKFLLHGEQDNHFLTTVEWSGNPEMDRKVKQRTYHVDNEHLAMIDNVDSFRPLQVRVRFPSLSAKSRWTVWDPMTDLYFSYDGVSAEWDAKRLLEGLVFSMEKRSQQFLLLSPASSSVRVSRADLVQTQTGMPLREGFDEIRELEDGSGDVTDDTDLIFLKTAPMGNRGSIDGLSGWVIGSGIFSADLNNGKVAQLRHGGGNLWSPSWSPDRKKIVFAHYALGRGQIGAMDADGSGAVNLSSNDYCDKLPVWSPNGRQIAFASDRDGNWEIYVMNADGSDQKRLTDSPGADTAPAWSPDGINLAFESDYGVDTDIYMMRVDGSDRRPIMRVGDDFEPAWSPDSQQIAFTSPDAQVRALVIADVKTGHLTIPTQGYHTWQVESPRWSPDGNHIAAVYYLTSNSGIVLFDLKPKPAKEATTGVPVGVVGVKDKPLEEISHKRLVDATSTAPYPGGGAFHKPGYPTWYAFGNAVPVHLLKRFYEPSWSDDGRQIAFSSNMDPTGAFFVYTVSINTETAAKPVKVPDSSSAWPQKVVWATK